MKRHILSIRFSPAPSGTHQRAHTEIYRSGSTYGKSYRCGAASAARLYRATTPIWYWETPRPERPPYDPRSMTAGSHVAMSGARSYSPNVSGAYIWRRFAQ